MLCTFLKQLSSNSKHKPLQEWHIPQVISKALASAKTKGPKATNECANGSLNDAPHSAPKVVLGLQQYLSETLSSKPNDKGGCFNYY